METWTHIEEYATNFEVKFWIFQVLPVDVLRRKGEFEWMSQAKLPRWVGDGTRFAWDDEWVIACLIGTNPLYSCQWLPFSDSILVVGGFGADSAIHAPSLVYERVGRLLAATSFRASLSPQLYRNWPFEDSHGLPSWQNRFRIEYRISQHNDDWMHHRHDTILISRPILSPSHSKQKGKRKE